MGFVIYAVQLFGERLKLCLLFWFKKEKKRNEERTKLHKRLKATQSKHWPLMKTIFLRIKPQILNPMGKKIRKRQILIELTYITSSYYFQWKNMQLASLSKELLLMSSGIVYLILHSLYQNLPMKYIYIYISLKDIPYRSVIKLYP